VSSGSSAGVISLTWALKANWVEFWFQPKINLKTRLVCGVEMLARVRHPLHGVLPARLFLAGTDLASIRELAVLGVRASLHAGRALAKLGARFPIAINVPVDVDTCAAFSELIIPECAPFPSRDLIFDIPEWFVAAAPGRFAELGARLAEQKIRLAVDDFGRELCKLLRPATKASELDSGEIGRLTDRLIGFRQVGFVEIKLDHDLIDGCAEDPRRKALCQLVIDLVHRHLDSTAVAVGIETAFDARCLTEIGCEVGQGFYFSHPVPLDDLINMIRRRATA